MVDPLLAKIGLVCHSHTSLHLQQKEVSPLNTSCLGPYFTEERILADSLTIKEEYPF
jgi:hypothetical protein